MNDHSAAEAYLTIPSTYGGSIAGLHWSHGCDAIEDANGATIAVFEQLVDVLDGVFAKPPVPPFAYVLQLLCALKRGQADRSTAAFERLRQAYLHAAGSPGLARNVGTLIAELCRGLSGLRHEPTWTDLKNELFRRRRSGEHRRPELAENPSLTSAEFESAITAAIERYDDATLVQFLRTAAAPSPAGDKLAESLGTLPERIRTILAQAANRPRLAGAAALIATIESALTIPARKRLAEAVPQGGYSDVTTRGDPDRLLPSQFALDPDDFVRRFAEHELLYFRREDPHVCPKPERVILLDQGVRTWGSIRHALAATALSLLGKNPTKHGEARLATERQRKRPTQPLTVDLLTALLESTDLTENPSLLLKSEIEATNPSVRDLILLTTARALQDSGIAEIANSIRPMDRLFVLTVEKSGHVELVEWNSFGPRSLRAFRVDLDAAESAVERLNPKPLPAIRESLAPWTGDVEPIVFPFRPGTLGNPTLFGFDWAGRWLVYVDSLGSIHVLDLSNPVVSPPEILPRAFRDGVVFKNVTEIRPVRDGVVLCGTIDLPNLLTAKPTQLVTIQGRSDPVMFSAATPSVGQSTSDAPLGATWRYCAAHYDFRLRKIRLFDFGVWDEPADFQTVPGYHAIVCIHYHYDAGTGEYRTNDTVSSAIDLETGQWSLSIGAQDSPARQALNEALNLFPQWELVPVYRKNELSGTLPKRVCAVLEDDGLQLCNTGNEWDRLPLIENGQFLAKGIRRICAKRTRSTLALGFENSEGRHLHLFQGVEGNSLSQYQHLRSIDDFRVAPTGFRVAFNRRGGVCVAETKGGHVLTTVPSAKLHSNLFIGYFQAKPFRLVICVGSRRSVIQLDGGSLVCMNITASELQRITNRSVPLQLHYDKQRFPENSVIEDGPFVAVLDRFGQIIIVDRSGEPVVHFIVRRGKAAAWLPDGTCWGDAGLLGGSATPSAAERIAEVIERARRRE